MDTGIKRRKSRASRKSRKSRKSTHRSRTAKKMPLPKTARVRSRPIAHRSRKSRAGSTMTLTELQFMAKSHGIPFGGLSKAKLIKKINNYY